MSELDNKKAQWVKDAPSRNRPSPEWLKTILPMVAIIIAIIVVSVMNSQQQEREAMKGNGLPDEIAAQQAR